MPGLVFALRRGDRVDHITARVDLLRNALDGAALARGVPAFEHFSDIGLAGESVRKIECLEH